MQALGDGKQVQDLEDGTQVQALEDGKLVQDFDHRNHLDSGKLFLVDVNVSGGALVFLGVLGALLVLVVLDDKQVQTQTAAPGP